MSIFIKDKLKTFNEKYLSIIEDYTRIHYILFGHEVVKMLVTTLNFLQKIYPLSYFSKCHFSENLSTFCWLFILDDLWFKFEYLSDFVWEQLNTGLWKDVNQCWRYMYAHLNYCKIIIIISIFEGLEDYTSISVLKNIKYIKHITKSIETLLIKYEPVCESYKSNIFPYYLVYLCDLSILSGSPDTLPFNANDGSNTLTMYEKDLFDINNHSPTIFHYIAQVCTHYLTGQLLYTNFSDSLQRGFDKILRSNEASINDFNLRYPVNEYVCPTLSFFSSLVQLKQPFVIVDALNIDEWPCIPSSNMAKSWKNLRYLLSVCGPRLIPVEIGSKYTDVQWKQCLMPFDRFVNDYLIGSNSLNKSNVLVSKAQLSTPKGYLAQHFLFDQIPELMQDFEIPIYCYVNIDNNNIVTYSDEWSNSCDDVEINCWFGPSKTVSPLHTDPKPNLLCQVFGCKYVRLYDPIYSDRLYAYEKSHLLSNNTSPIDVEHPDYERFPNFLNVPYSECILRTGEMLYIPPGYWHYVRSLEPTFSINFWWQ